jgi:hypothetical protein
MSELGGIHKVILPGMGLFGGLLLWSAATQARVAVTARKAEGTVLSYVTRQGTITVTRRELVNGKYEDRQDEQSFLGPAPVIRYVVDGHVYEVEGQPHQSEHFKVGAKVVVVYDSLDPRWGHLEEEAGGWGAALITALVGLVFIGSAVGIMVAFGGWGRHLERLRAA